MNDTFMKEKPVLPLILSMSLPMVLSMLVNSLYNIVDSFFVAQISEEAMTALWNWIWRWDQCSDRLLSGRGGS